MIKVSSANFYVGNKDPKAAAKKLASLDCDINGVQEGHSGNVQAIRTALEKTHKVYVHGASIERQDVPVVVPRTLKVRKSWARTISQRSQVENIGMPRAATVVRFEKDGETFTFINTHTNAAVQDKVTKQPRSVRIKRVSEFVKGTIILEAMIRNAKRRGDHVILVGDLNYRVVKGKPWHFSPQGLFVRNNMKYRNRGLDYIAYSKGLVPFGGLEVISEGTGSDHPWLTLNLKTRKA